ncbi:FG-GAP-like repeat-containing protein [Nocardioides pantholopis]|uniref:FG-GAP-like repeat-containing protein n=1 Tax=Nocardioides pantholopis TaxID=2483798 RepID=UPI000F088FD5|nr:FG-GAP-like repeat-containing protein [Nocardioides pantholopis]
MHPIKARFVTACQQLLALAVVLAVLVPTTGVMTLDVASPGVSGAGASFAAYAAESTQTSPVPAGQVEATVEEVPLTPPAGAPAERRAVPGAEAAPGEAGALTVTSEPQAVEGYGAVGVTWDSGDRISDADLTVRARTLSDGAWSDWTELEYHDEHAPDPGSPEAAAVRPGTDELLVGEVDQVQVEATVADGAALPADMRLAVVDPGEAEATAMERPAIDTGELPGTAAAPVEAEPAGEVSDDAIELRAAATAPKPTIYSRAQWGADEKLRDKKSLRYGSVSAGFVHHTVNANDYTRAQVPGILRSIYAYHTKSRGWSDVGYNFLVDRFGRIWEGRAGGVDKAVVGAHTLGYNDYAFAMSAVGNFETAKPSAALVQAYGALMAWKLSLHGVSPSASSQKVGSKRFPAISGHRDAGSTACPGKNLYAKIPEIRKLAAAVQTPATPTPPAWTGRELEANLADSPHPDLVVRRASDKRLLVLPTRGLTSFARRSISSGWKKYTAVVASPDLTRDGRADVLVQNKAGTVAVRPGKAGGGFRGPLKGTKQFRKMSLITAVGDLNRDGRNDVVALHKASTRLYVFFGRGNGTFKRKRLAKGWGYTRLAATGDVTGDGRVDLIGRDAQGVAWLHKGAGRRFAGRTKIATGWKSYDAVTGFGDYTQDGRNDLFVRHKNGRGYVLPGTGRGRFGSAIGPIGGAAGMKGLSAGGSISGTADPDLLGRRGDKLVVLQHAGTTELGGYVDTGQTAPDARTVLNVGDWDRDGDADVMIVTTAGELRLLAGDGQGHLAAPQTIATGFAGVTLLAAVGDMTGDGWPDLMGQPAGSGMHLYPGAGPGALGAGSLVLGAIPGSVPLGVARWDGGTPGILVRASNRPTLYGTGPGSAGARTLAGNLKPYNWAVGIRDIGLTGHPDVLVRRKGTGDLFLLPGSTAGFGKPRYLGGGMNAFDLAG